MTAKDRPVSKPATDDYRSNFDKIFGKKKMNRSDIEMAIVKHLLERAKEFGSTSSTAIFRSTRSPCTSSTTGRTT